MAIDFLEPVTTKNLRHDLRPINLGKVERKRVGAVQSNLDAGLRFDPDYVGRLAREISPNPPILDVIWRTRGGPVDVYFVTEDREAGYAAAAPVIRKLLQASSLALDFHVLEPAELETEV